MEMVQHVLLGVYPFPFSHRHEVIVSRECISVRQPHLGPPENPHLGGQTVDPSPLLRISALKVVALATLRRASRL